MRSAKDEVREVLNLLPDNCTTEDIQYTLYVREAIRAGEADIEAGRVHPQEEVERMIESWFGDDKGRAP